MITTPVALNDVWEWAALHSETLDIITYWFLLAGSFVLGVAKLVSWWVLRGTTDVERLGRSLKRQKLSESIAWFSLSGLYATMVAVSYGYRPMEHERLLLRLTLWFAISLAAVYVILFVGDLKNDDAETIIERDARQEATDIRQDERDVLQDQREREMYRHDS